MAFEVLKSYISKLPRGAASLDTKGRVRFSADDLKAVGIDRGVTILIDRKAKLIGIRAPRKCEIPRIVRMNCRSTNYGLWLTGAMSALKIRPEDVAGVHEVEIRDGAIVIDLGG